MIEAALDTSLKLVRASQIEMSDTHQTAKTQYISFGDIKYAYRRFGNENGKTPLLFLIHFRGVMDLWDPLLVNNVAATRPVILFDNAGVGKSTGSVPATIKGMAAHVIAFIQAFGLQQVDVLGFSMGGMIAPLVFLDSPRGLVRKLVLAGTTVSAGEGIVGNTEERTKGTVAAASQPEPDYDNCFNVIFFYPSETSQAAGRAWWKRVHERNESTSGEPRSNVVSWQYADQGAGLKAMSAAGAAFGNRAKADEGSFDRLAEINIPVFIAQGKDDYMIPTHNSYVMQQKLPNARLKIFEDSGHGFLYQHAREFGDDVNRFLDQKA